MLLGLGDNCVDIYVDEAAMYPGGNAVNVAVFAARLGQEAHYAGRLGPDDFGRFLLEQIAAECVGVESCRIEPGETTAWTRIGVRDGERVFLASHPGPSGAFRLDERQRALAGRADAIHLSVYALPPPKDIATVRRPGCLVSLDVSTRPIAQASPHLANVDVVTLSTPFRTFDRHASEAAEIAACGPWIVVIGHGANGATIHANGEAWLQPAMPAKVVDTLGAGDAFIARMLVGLIDREPLRAAAEAASGFAARTCERRGAFGTSRKLVASSADR